MSVTEHATNVQAAHLQSRFVFSWGTLHETCTFFVDRHQLASSLAWACDVWDAWSDLTTVVGKLKLAQAAVVVALKDHAGNRILD